MILVTGATGIVGSHIVIELLKAGEEVRVLHRKTSNFIALTQLLKFHNLSNTVHFFEGDISDPVSLSEAIEGCHRVYHCAAMVSFDPSDARQLHETNVLGTDNVVNACLKENVKLTYISSTATIGDVSINGMRTEDSVWVSDKGKSDYTLSKRYAELEVFRGVQEGLDVTVVNPGVILGPGNWGNSSTTIFLSGLKGLKFYPSGGNGFVDARDVAEFAISLSKNDNVSGKHLLIGENMSFKEFFTSFHHLFGSKKPSVAIPKAPVLVIVNILSALEKLRMSPLKMTSENLKSAYRKMVYSNQKMTDLGYAFRTVNEAMKYTNEVYKLRNNL
jgi:dihydroflavonol-4-reductase